MKKTIIKILSILSCIVVFSVCLFAFPSSAAVGDVVWNMDSMDELFAKDEDFGSDDFEFRIVQSGEDFAQIYDVYSSIVFKNVNSGLIFGGELLFPIVDSSKNYQVKLPITFADIINDAKPKQVIINFYDSSGVNVIRQIGQTKYADANVAGTGDRIRTFLFDFNISGVELNKCKYIEFFITLESTTPNWPYLYCGVHKNNGLSIREALSEDTQAIINNQNSNTDKIVNGGSTSPHYTKPDDSAAIQQDELTENIEDSTSDGVDSANNLFSSFNSLLGDGSYISRGLLAVTTILNEFLGINWLTGLITFSLTLGIFSFLLGMGFFIGRMAHVGKDKYSSKQNSKG